MTVSVREYENIFRAERISILSFENHPNSLPLSLSHMWSCKGGGGFQRYPVSYSIGAPYLFQFRSPKVVPKRGFWLISFISLSSS